MKGRALIDRKVLFHPVVGMKNPAKFAAWIWMILQARWKAGTVPIHNNNEIYLERGQFSHSIRFISEATGLTQAITRAFLKRLEKEHMVKIEINTGQQVITICNYNAFQKFDLEDNTGSKCEITQANGELPLEITQALTQRRTKGLNTSSKREKISHADIVDLWHKICDKSPKILKITSSRTSHLNARIREDLKTIEEWESYFRIISDSEFLTGQKHNWFNFDWVLKPNKMIDILEGKFTNGSSDSFDRFNLPDSEWVAMVKGFERNGQWHDDWGLKPDENGNDVPEAILKENNYLTFTNNRSE